MTLYWWRGHVCASTLSMVESMARCCAGDDELTNGFAGVRSSVRSAQPELIVRTHRRPPVIPRARLVFRHSAHAIEV
jgi:hypothetical protein